jgi:1-aminocyclopropane-1-carboxylate deaminase/D-cysteine desulfhydrase-like pyridoxal-dependent ACC family enzyme
MIRMKAIQSYSDYDNEKEAPVLQIFKEYPELVENLPHISLGLFPTPVLPLKRLGNHLGTDRLYLKQDGESGVVYGGNKIRKLEFLLGDALRKKAKTVLTFGFAGSNHALATAIYARRAGLNPISVLLRQSNARYVGRNLLMELAQGAEILHFPNEKAAYLPVMATILKKAVRDRKFPYMIPPGGSSPLGAIGYVNAAFELKQQIQEGLLPEPDVVFVPLGTMGTAVGLLLGLKACALKTKVISVRVTDLTYANEKKFNALFESTLRLIRSAAPSFPAVRAEAEDIHIVHEYFGQEYARFTEQGIAAMDTIHHLEGLCLEGTYTGKTMAAMIDYLKQPGHSRLTALFWNTYNSRNFSDELHSIDYRGLPRGCHFYFESEVQPLDRSTCH